jgi:thiol-disulfide isomerase/thioredoxin
MINPKRNLLLLALVLVSFTLRAQPKYRDDVSEIALPAVSGDTLRLSGLKGKVILLDFWASWCKPCRESNKDLVKLYNKYKDKGFEIFSVSLDDDHEKWEKAIKKDKITWLQVNEPGGWDAPVAVKWNIFAIPTSYLIDKDGKLFAMDLEGKDLEQAIRQLLAN